LKKVGWTYYLPQAAHSASLWRGEMKSEQQRSKRGKYFRVSIPDCSYL